MLQPLLYPTLPHSLEIALRNANPWWRGERPCGLPDLHRWALEPILRKVQQGLTPITALQGPSQAGKTTLLKQVINALLEQDMGPQRIFLLPCNTLPGLHDITEPLLMLTRWFAAAVLKKSLNQAAHDGEQAYIFLDDVQTLSDWAPQLKHLVDMQPVRVLVTSSITLNQGTGKTSFAGRLTTVKLDSL